MAISILIFLIVLSVLILVHEFGHYWAAKRAGVLVEEFGIGFPPKIYGKKIGETIYLKKENKEHSAVLLEKLDNGRCLLRLAEDVQHEKVLDNIGYPPLPP